MNRALAEKCQEKFAPSERLKTRVTEIEGEVKEFEGKVKEFEGEVKEKGEISPLTGRS